MANWKLFRRSALVEFMLRSVLAQALASGELTLTRSRDEPRDLPL